MDLFKNQNEKVWRVLSYIWTIVFMVFIVINFFEHDRYEFLVPPLAAIYTAILGLYVGTKEFERWHDFHKSRHPGELFVILWTIIVFVLLGVAFFLDNSYRVDSEIVAVYIVVMSVFALTQKSKRLYRHKKGH